jgi:hypothetical protein
MNSNTELVVWQSNALAAIPKQVKQIEDLVSYGIQLQTKDKKQIVSAFNNEAYEMVSTYTWTKAITSLKKSIEQNGCIFYSGDVRQTRY